MSKETNALATLRKQIAKLTGRLPREGASVEYLERRLADLRKQQANGEEVKRHHSEPTVVTTVSMPAPAKDALVRMADAKQMTVSELARTAIGEWAERHGHKVEAAHFLLSEEA
jgi:hypothetical protein